MSKIYFTIAGTNHYHGTSFFKKGMRVELTKEPDNKYDAEAIRVDMEALGKVGYVANSTHTVLGESKSAGRIYDRVGKKSYGKVVHILPEGVICELKEKKKKKG